MYIRARSWFGLVFSTWSMAAFGGGFAWGAATDVDPKFVSPSDPAAQWTGALRGPAFFAYADNDLIDLQAAVIVDVEASRAVRGSNPSRAVPYT